MWHFVLFCRCEFQATQLYGVLKPVDGATKRTEHRLDVAGKCVQGQHPDVLKGHSALLLATCIETFVQDIGAFNSSSRIN